MRVIAGIKATQKFIKGMQHNSFGVSPMVRSALHHADTVIKIHIPSHALTGWGRVSSRVAGTGMGKGAGPAILTGDGISSLIGYLETASKR
jgi:hypothetical protein